MTQHQLSTYLTMELIGSYSPQALSNIKEREIKLWLCPVTCLPIFSNSAYGGPSHPESGLPTIGHPTIHIRVPKLSVESVEDDASIKSFLYSIYQQIHQQLHLLVIQDNLVINLERSIAAKQKNIDILTTLFREKECQNATEIVH